MTAIIRRAEVFLVGLLLAAAVAAVTWYWDQRGATVAGAPRVVDGDSLWVAGVEIRLYGIDAPEHSQTCVRGGRHWACGQEAGDALRRAVAGREVSCRARDRDRYGRTVAICLAAGLDLGAAMVKGGMAVSYGAYEADEREARDARRGIWASSFERPAAWRAAHPRGRS